MNNQDQQLNKEPIPKQEPAKRPKPKWLVPVIVVAGVIVLGLAVWGGYELFKPACVGEGETIPVIANPPKCCSGLELIAPKSSVLGIYGICTAKCGNNVCDLKTESPQNCPEDCEEPDETADWEIYQNEEYGFEVKYPGDWEIERDLNKRPPQEIFASPYNTDEYKQCYRVGIEIEDNPNEYSATEWLNDYVKNFPTELKLERSIKQFGVLKGEEVIGFPWIIEVLTFFISKDNKIFNFYLIPYDKGVTPQHIIDTYNQILSTFKFIE